MLDEGGPLSLALAVARAAVAEVPGVVPDYIGALDPRRQPTRPGRLPWRRGVASPPSVGDTRLIDNVMTRVGRPRGRGRRLTDRRRRTMTFKTLQRPMMISKIHRATVTQADLHYVGSITIDATLMEAADLMPGQQVDVVDVTNGVASHDVRDPGRAGLRRDLHQRCGRALGARGRPGDHHRVRADRRRGGQEYEPHVVFVDAANRIVDVCDEPGQVPADSGLERSGWPFTTFDQARAGGRRTRRRA